MPRSAKCQGPRNAKGEPVPTDIAIQKPEQFKGQSNSKVCLLRVTLHIGHEKTGTTSIQRYLDRQFSAPGQALYYPTAGRHPGTEQHELLFQHLAADNPDFFITDMLPEMKRSGAEHIILSSELFSVLTRPANLALVNFLEVSNRVGLNLTVVCFVREAYPFLRSLFVESLKWNWKLEFAEFVETHLSRLDDEALKALIDVYRVKNIFLPYDKGDAASAFMAAVAPDFAYVPEVGKERLNSNTPEWMAPLLLMTNRTFNSGDFTRSLIEAASRGTWTPPEWFDAETYFALPEGMLQAIADIEANDTVRRAMFAKT